MTTEEWFAKFTPGTEVRFTKRGQEHTGMVMAQWRGRDGYMVRVVTSQGAAMDVDPVADDLEVR